MTRIDTRLEKLERTALGPVEHIAVDFLGPVAAQLSDQQRQAIIDAAYRRAGPRGQVVILAWPGDWTPECDKVIQLRWPEELNDVN